MRNTYFFKSLLLLISLMSFNSLFSQIPDRVLVGYWHNWESLRLSQVDDRYNVICLAFMEANGGDWNKDNNSVNDLKFEHPYISESDMISDIAALRAQGKIVLMSIGGANGSFALLNQTQKDTYVQKMKAVIQKYGLDGIDIDIERPVYLCDPWGTLDNPITSMQNLIDGTKEIMTWFQTQYGKKMILTTAPEVAYTTGALSPYGSCKGAFLPFIHQLRDEIDLVMVQLYNSGDNYSIQYNNTPRSYTTYFDGTVDFVITQTEAIIEGFTINNGNIPSTYLGMPENKIAVALPASTSQTSAGSGYLTPSNVKKAVEYLMGCGSKPGSYTLNKSYPALRGLMTWSINEDSKSTSGVYSFAGAFSSISCGVITSAREQDLNESFSIFPNPSSGVCQLESASDERIIVRDLNGTTVLSFQPAVGRNNVNFENLPSGVYFLQQGTNTNKLVLQ